MLTRNIQVTCIIVYCTNAPQLSLAFLLKRLPVKTSFKQSCYLFLAVHIRSVFQPISSSSRNACRYEYYSGNFLVLQKIKNKGFELFTRARLSGALHELIMLSTMLSKTVAAVEELGLKSLHMCNVY